MCVLIFESTRICISTRPDVDRLISGRWNKLESSSANNGNKQRAPQRCVFVLGEREAGRTSAIIDVQVCQLLNLLSHHNRVIKARPRFAESVTSDPRIFGIRSKHCSAVHNIRFAAFRLCALPFVPAEQPFLFGEFTKYQNGAYTPQTTDDINDSSRIPQSGPRVRHQSSGDLAKMFVVCAYTIYTRQRYPAIIVKIGTINM